MKHKSHIRKALACSTLLLLVACNGGGGSSSSGGGTNPVTPLTPPADPSLTLTVTASPNSSLCGYANAPCTSIQICEPNSPNTCTTVDNILVDTGSFGLRVFRSALNGLALTNESQSGRTVAECVTYGDNSANWGPVAFANVQFPGTGQGLIAESIPMQIIDVTFTGLADSCPGATQFPTPADFGVNGIIGVGPLTNDQGDYFLCNGGGCTGSAVVTESNQVYNPVAWLESAQYNNGITLEFPAVGSNGGTGVVGYAVFGVGTNASNTVVSGIKEYHVNINLSGVTVSMPTQYSGNANINAGFLDTGSNALYFNDNSITQCDPSDPNNPFYCPSGILALSASNTSTTGSVATGFSVANANTLFNTSNGSFSNLGGTFEDPYLDYGLPFFFGRGVNGTPPIYVGFVGRSSSIDAAGQYWAF